MEYYKINNDYGIFFKGNIFFFEFLSDTLGLSYKKKALPVGMAMPGEPRK
jgi:hypothetical protein